MGNKKIKEDDKTERTIRALLKLPENKRCINCNLLVRFSLLYLYILYVYFSSFMVFMYGIIKIIRGFRGSNFP